MTQFVYICVCIVSKCPAVYPLLISSAIFCCLSSQKMFTFVQKMCVKDCRLLCLCCCGVVPPAVVFSRVGGLLHPTDYDSPRLYVSVCVCVYILLFVYQYVSRFKFDFFFPLLVCVHLCSCVCVMLVNFMCIFVCLCQHHFSFRLTRAPTDAHTLTLTLYHLMPAKADYSGPPRSPLSVCHTLCCFSLSSLSFSFSLATHKQTQNHAVKHTHAYTQTRPSFPCGCLIDVSLPRPLDLL